MRSLIGAVVVLTLAAGCSGDDEDSPGAAGATTTASLTTTSVADEGCAGDAPMPPTAPGGGPAELVATHADLAFSIVDRGASVEIVAVSQLAGCTYEPVLLSGEAATFPIGGSVTHGDGIRCTDAGITVLSATSDDGVTYQATAVDYQLEGDGLVESDRSASTIDAREEPDELDGYYRLDC